MSDFVVQVQASLSIRAEDRSRSTIISEIASETLDRIAATSRGYGITECQQISAAASYFTATVTVSELDDELQAILIAARQLRAGLTGISDPGRKDDGLISFKIDESAFTAEPALKMAV